MQTFTSSTEEWRPISGFPGYEVSNKGNIRSFLQDNEGHILRPSCNKNRYGYLHVLLSNGKKMHTRRVHRLVAEAFIPNPENKPEVNHIDCNTANNKADNLEWVTAKENSEWKMKCGHCIGEHKRPVYATNLLTGERTIYESLKEAERHGFHRTAIRKCIRGVFSNHKNHIWKYAE